MILFSDRAKLAQVYQRWLVETSAAMGPNAAIMDCPESVFAFLCSFDALHEDAVKERIANVKLEKETP